MQTQAKETVPGADKIAIDGITYEIVRREVKADGVEQMFLRRPRGKRFYLAFRSNGFARIAA